MRTIEAVAARVQQPTLRGQQSIAAVWFPRDWFDPVTQARRIVACWRPGATAMRFPQGDLLCYPSAVEMDCHTLPGWPLRQDGRVLTSAALRKQELAAAPAGDVLIVLGAEIVALQMRDAVPLDPATWLNVGRLALHETYDCTTALPPPNVLDLDARPVREILGDAVPPASAEQLKFLQAVREAQRARPHTEQPTQNVRAPSKRGIGFWLIFPILAVILWLLDPSHDTPAVLPLAYLAFIVVMAILLAGGSRHVQAVEARQRGQPVRTGAAAPAESFPARQKKEVQPQRWRQWLTRWAMTSQLARLIGRAQARYMRRMLELFEDGKLDEALRHAIPLGGESLGQALGTPTARRDLTLSSGTGAAATLNLGDALEQHLRALYRKAFNKLDREGRIDEAVFVLAELLNAKQEALDYLEKHQRFKQAAELALGWDMPPDVIVRLYCLADDWKKAIAVARRDSAFAGAVLQLEKKSPAAARRLRMEWGVALTHQGDWLGAVEVIWREESFRAKAAEWLLAAESVGGKLGARALVQRAILLPDTLQAYAEQFEELRSDPTLWVDRANLAEALLGAGRDDALKALAAIITPMVIADHAQNRRSFDRNTLQKLLDLTDDSLLRADLPADGWPVLERVAISQLREALVLDAPAAGAYPILDAVPLHDQRYLVALGEAGVCIVDSTGRKRTHFSIPAQRLVLSHSRQVALALTRRESSWRVSRIDLAQRNIVDLGLGEFDHFCTHFDGLHWTIARGNRLQVLDTEHSLREIVWQVTELPGPVTALANSMHQEHMLVKGPDGLEEHWIYQLPQRRLTSRDQLPALEGQLRLLNTARGSIDVALEQMTPNETRLRARWNRSGSPFEYNLWSPTDSELVLWTDNDWLVVGASGYFVHWLLPATGRAHVSVRWPDAFRPTVRALGHEWLMFDAGGRLLSFNTEDGTHQKVTIR